MTEQLNWTEQQNEWQIKLKLHSFVLMLVYYFLLIIYIFILKVFIFCLWNKNYILWDKINRSILLLGINIFQFKRNGIQIKSQRSQLKVCNLTFEFVKTVWTHDIIFSSLNTNNKNTFPSFVHYRSLEVITH